MGRFWLRGTIDLPWHRYRYDIRLSGRLARRYIAAAPQTTRRYLGAVADPFLQLAVGEGPAAAIDSLRRELSSPALFMEQ
jgi:hypothetical protein